MHIIGSGHVTRTSVRSTVCGAEFVVGENVPFYQTGGYKELALVAGGLSTRFVS